MSFSDTTYALASAPGKAGVAVVRLSGQRCDEILAELVKTLPAPRMAALRDLYVPKTDKKIDQALVLRFKAPASYTGEDMVEFHLHGSRAVVTALSDVLSGLGARLAEPGEFTRRAVMNGKLDLTAAEAVMDLIESETEAQATQALRQLSGELKSLYDGWRQRLTRAQAHLEAAIDFADDDIPPSLLDEVRASLQALQTEMQAHLADARRGERLREGVHAVIIGAPNAGKSSLLNRLAQREAAIVTPIAGTTRDTLDVALDVGGYPLLITDTAGLRATDDVVEKEGVRRALLRASEADFRILLCDATAPDHAETLAQAKAGDLVVYNKCDLTASRVLAAEALSISALTGEGLPALLAALTDKAKNLAGLTGSPALTRTRHRDAVSETLQALERAFSAPAIDQMAEDVRLASRALGRITGQVGVEDLLDVIFRDFCLGK